MPAPHNQQPNIFARLAGIFSHKPSLWTSSLAPQAAKDK